MLRSMIVGGAAVLACSLAHAQQPLRNAQNLYPVTAPVRDAGALDVSTGKWKRAGQQPGSFAASGPVVFDNTCSWPGGGFYVGLEDCEAAFSHGRVPSTSSPSAPAGATDDNSISSFTFAYCTYNTSVSIQIAFFDNLGGECAGGLPPTPPPLSTHPSLAAGGYFDLTGFGLPAATAPGFLACWTMTIDTSNSTFCLASDGDGTWDNDVDLDRFTWAMRHSNPNQGIADGFILAGDPNTTPPGSCTYSNACGTDPFSAGPCGTGLDTSDNLWVNVDGVAVGDTQSGLCPGGFAQGGGTNCYSFGYPAQPLASTYLSIQSKGACSGCPPPVITQQPVDSIRCPGATALFATLATGTDPVNYVWTEVGTGQQVGSGPTLNIPNVMAADDGRQFQCTVLDACGITQSNIATLVVLDPPQITQDPTDETVCVGDPASFTCQATGDGLSYQWFEGSAPVGTGPTLSFPSTSASDNGRIFHCVVSGTCSPSAVSATAALGVRLPPDIVVEPTGVTVDEGQTASFSLGVTGAAPLSYVWSELGGTVVGTSPGLDIPNVTPADDGRQFFCTVSNDCGSDVSAIVTLGVFDVGPNPTLASQIEDQMPPEQGIEPEEPDRFAHSVPVGLFNGEVQLSVVDLEIPGRGLSFRWERTYSSRSNFDRAHGRNWTNRYDRRVVIDGSGNASVVDGLGREDLFQNAGGGNFTSPRTIYSTLVRNGDNTYTQREPDGRRYEYDTAGYLARIEDARGNALDFTRNGHNNITLVRDTQDRDVTIAYTDATASQRVQTVTDFMGRQVHYTYDGNGNLIRARSPLVTGTPNGNDFPNGKATLYVYSSGFGDARLNHNLLQIIDPEYNVNDDPLQSTPTAVLTYASTTDPSDIEFDRVVAERWGHDTGGPAWDPVAGGTSTFEYEDDLTGDGDAPTEARQRTRVTDRNGNVRRYYFNRLGRQIRRVVETNRDIRPGEQDQYVTDFEYDSDRRLIRRVYARGNETRLLYDANNPRQASRGDLLERRFRPNSVGGDTEDLVYRYTYDQVFHRRRTETDPRAFPNGVVPLDVNGHLDLTDALVARYTTTNLFDYQEGTGFQTAQGIPASEQLPEGLGDLNGAADFDEGNVVRRDHPTIQTAGPNNGDVIREQMTYNDRGQMLTHVDPEGNVTAYSYYPSNGTPQDPSDREGYLRDETRDPGGLDLITTFDYDAAGNLTSRVDPKGRDTTFTVNQLNQVVESFTREVATGVRYRTRVRYDANDRVIETRRENRDENGALRTHSELVDAYEYDILDRVVAEERDRTRDDGSSAGTVRREFYYDGNMNRIATRTGESTNGNEVDNVVTVLYDERDLIFRIVRGDGDADPSDAPPADSVVETRNYDANGNRREVIDRLRDAVSASAPTTAFPGSAAGDVRRFEYDGYDRLDRLVDREGNEVLREYDRASNETRRRLRGPVDHTTGAAVLDLREELRDYDEVNRVVREDLRHFDRTGADIGDGHRIWEYRYDREGKLTRRRDDNGDDTTILWDAADRRLRVTDPLGNEEEFAYDDNDNVTTRTRRDVSTDLGSGTDTYVTTYEYDGIDRIIRATDPSGSVFEWGYDSRDNEVRQVDGVRGSGHPSGPGNVVRIEYDGLDRPIRRIRELTSNGRGDGTPTGSIETRREWDDNSRLRERYDGLNNRTRYEYDRMDRRIRILYADGSERTTTYDVDGRVDSWTDARGSSCVHGYDGLDRLLTRSVTPGAGVLGSTSETYGYDGANHITLAQTDDWLGTGDLICTFEYDSHGNRTRDDQGGLRVDSEYDNRGNRTRVTYPGRFGGGRRVLDNTFDSLYRRRAVVDMDNGTVAEWRYKGSRRIERRTYGPFASPVSRLDRVYDGLPRVTDMHHRTGAGATIARLQYGYDRMHNRLFEKRLHDGEIGEVFSYDSIYRMRRHLREVDLTGVAPGDEILPGTFDSTERMRCTYDDAGNRVNELRASGGAINAVQYTRNEMNEYTRIYPGYGAAFSTRRRAYDENGNLTDDGRRRYHYDFRNRLVEVRQGPSDTLVVQYLYDALGRRGERVLANPSSRVRFLFDGLQCVEERDQGNNITRQYVWGEDVNNLLEIRTATEVFYAHENAMGSVVALVDGLGVVRERYRYGGFGETTVELDGATGNEFRYHGARLDPETGLYYMRARVFSTREGRFLQRDPIGVWGDELNIGNAYTFVGNNPMRFRDPTGLTSDDRGNRRDVFDRARSESVEREWNRAVCRVEPRRSACASLFRARLEFSSPGSQVNRRELAERARTAAGERFWRRRHGFEDRDEAIRSNRRELAERARNAADRWSRPRRRIESYFGRERTRWSRTLLETRERLRGLDLVDDWTRDRTGRSRTFIRDEQERFNRRDHLERARDAAEARSRTFRDTERLRNARGRDDHDDRYRARGLTRRGESEPERPRPGRRHR